MTEFDFKNPDYAAVYDERVARIRRIRSGSINLNQLHEFYRTHPVEFITDWGCTFDPRAAEIGQPTTMPFILFKRQAEFITWLYERWQGREDGLCEKSRDMGVSWLCVAFAVWMFIFRSGTVVGFGSRKEEYVDKIGDPKSLFWKARTFIDLLPKEFRPIGWDSKLHAPHMRILNPENGSSIVGEAGDNIGRGNRTSIYFKDESAFYKHADSVDAALSQTSNCKIDVSTPNGPGNPFYRKRHGGRIKVFVFDWKDDPRKDKDWYQRQCDTLDAVVVAQEIDRDYSASVTNVYIPGRIVKPCMMRGPADVQGIGPMQMGIDPARFGNDKTVFTFRQGRLCQEQVVFGKVDVVDVAGRAKDAIIAMPEPVEQIAVDVIGLGAGVADILRRDFGDAVVDINSSLRLDDGQNYNLRARMWRDMAEWLKGPVSIPNDSELEIDLTSLRYGYKGGQLLIESKEDAKKRGIKSPDRADSLALTFGKPVLVDTNNNRGQHKLWDVLDELTAY